MGYYDRDFWFHIIDHSFFFWPLERDLIAHAEADVVLRPNSFFTVIFFPFLHAISRYFVPEIVTPSAIALVGLFSCFQSYQLISGCSRDFANVFPDTEAQTRIFFSCLLCFVSVICASLDAVHALRCNSATPLSDIFSRVCSNISLIFFAFTLMEAFNISDTHVRWYLLMALQLIGFNTVVGKINADNLRAKKAKNFAYCILYYIGYSELSFLIFCVLIMRLVFAARAFDIFLNFNFLKYLFFCLLTLSFVNVALLKMKQTHKTLIAMCLAARGVPLVNILSLNGYSILNVASGALVVALLSIEVHVSNLAKRRVHAAVFCISVGLVFDDYISIFFSIMYLFGMLVDLSYYTRIPLFVPLRNVFCDGVFDLCHAGHKIFMRNALKYGNRLIVGVCGDDELESYKRRPIMSLEERVNEVRLCKFVSQVIPNSPVSGVTEEMIRRHNIHFVVCGKEYDKEGDTYYAVPRRLGILRTAPRTAGISTSILIARIRAASDEDVKAKDKILGHSTVNEGE